VSVVEPSFTTTLGVIASPVYVCSEIVSTVNVMTLGLTVTLQESVLLPSAVVTLIVAVPTFLAVITPPVDTSATVVLLLFHDKFWFVALEGVIAAVRSSVPPTTRLTDVLLSETSVTGTTTLLTVTVQDSVLLPLTVVTVIVAVPALTAVTTPSDTVATAVSLLLHVIFLFVALSGSIIANRVSVLPTKRSVDVLFSDTPVT